MICGNEAAIIEQCLESAAEAFDELCLVQAVGDGPADDTLNIAEKWCRTNGKAYQRRIYKNTASMPHVDDFAAARNKAFGLAVGDWLLWLDCDDYLTPVNCRRIREAVKETKANAIFATYKVEKHGAEILRERLIRNGCGRWRNAIHETCLVQGEADSCPQIEVYHRDHTAKNRSSAERNARILKAVVEDAPRHYFYLQAELKMLGDKEGALRAARAALALLPDTSTEEKYHVLLNLSELEPEKAEQHLLQAARMQPHRREAFGYLTQEALNRKDKSAAVSWFRIMDALPEPSPIPWTHQGIWYERRWARNLLRVRVLRLCGHTEQAEREHVENMSDPDYANYMEKEQHE